MIFHFVQGGGVIVLLDEGFNEIEDLLLSLGKHRVKFRFTFDNSILGERSQQKDMERGGPQKKHLLHRPVEEVFVHDLQND